jgi:lipopolysaccharide/colanic/teichoic acid biosynthesis glycosyltransferase
MTISSNLKARNNGLWLFLGDSVALIVSLFSALVARYGTLPSFGLFIAHIVPFSFLFVISIIVYYVAGLYEKQTLVLKRRLPQILINVQIVNAIIAIAFFYFIPYFSITPKTFLFIYLVITLILTTWWRMTAVSLFDSKKVEPVLVLSSRDGDDIDDLFQEINNNPRYGMKLVTEKTAETRAIIADFADPSIHSLIPSLYKLIFSGITFMDIRDLYEDMFDRIPLSLLDDAWCVKYISAVSKVGFDLAKRSLDVAISFVLGIVSLFLFPFVYLAIKLDDRGVVFSYQTRVGQNGVPIKIMKFRTMSVANDDGKWGASTSVQVVNTVTRVGAFLRKSRIDELPQLWNVLKGDISLIGPRPEFPDPVASYSEKIPYYSLRHIVKPGLSGWAQIYHEKHPHHGLDTEETRNKLAYDLYYIKNRSFMLDIKIALRTLKVLISFAGK